MIDREERIRTLLPAVRSIARRLKRLVPSFDLDDLVGDGCIGLIRAVDAYDPSRGPTLEAFARRSVLGAMLNGIRRMDPVSERVRRTARAGDAMRYTVASERGSLPSPAEIEPVCPGYLRALTAIHRGQPLSLDAPLPERERWTAQEGSDPASVVQSYAQKHALALLIAELPARERAIVVAHYFAGTSLRAIGRRMAISPQRVSQLHLCAIERLKRRSHAGSR